MSAHSAPNDGSEAAVVLHAERLLTLMCSNVQREFELSPGGLRVDLKGELPNGEFALVECKQFGDNLTPLVDAIMQAASYADSIRYPVFIGPVPGSRSTIASGRLDNALGALHLVAGRLNVGFLCFTEHNGAASLLLRGQKVACSVSGAHSEFAKHWGYVQRIGSKQVRS